MVSARRYILVAFLPVLLALVTLLILYTYQQGEDARRESRQKPEQVLDFLGVRAGMRVAEHEPTDGFFLRRLARRVGPEGRVYAIHPRYALAQKGSSQLPPVEVAQEPPEGLDVLLILRVRASDQDLDELRDILKLSHRRLRVGGRVGVIGVGSKRIRGFIGRQQIIAAAQSVGFALVAQTEEIPPQFLVVAEK